MNKNLYREEVRSEGRSRLGFKRAADESPRV